MADVDVGIRNLLQGAVAHVSHDADDLGAVAEPSLADTDRFPDRVLVGPESARRRLVDEHDLGRPEAIRGSETAPPQQRNPHGPEVARRHPVDSDRRLRPPRDLRSVPKPDQGAVAPAGQRRAIAHPRRCDARERGGAGLELAEELDRRLAPVLACRQVDAASQEVLGIDAAAGRQQPAEALDHQPRADQKHERKRNLRRREKAPAGEASRSAGACRLQAAALERVGQFRARRGKRRREAEQDAGGKRRRGREEQGGPVQAHGAQRDQAVARKPPTEWVGRGRIDRGENVNSPGRERRAGERAQRGEQYALCQELPNQAAAAGSDREPDRDLALARA